MLPIIINFNTIPDILYLHTQKVVGEERLTAISGIAHDSLAQLAAALAAHAAYSQIVGSFFMPRSMKKFAILIAAALVVGAVTRAAQCLFPNSTYVDKWGKFYDPLAGRLARIGLVNLLTQRLNAYIHEFGHCAAALMTHIDSKPTISASTTGLTTSYAVSYGLTRFGSMLGEDNARLFVTAAGLMNPILSAMVEFAMAYAAGSATAAGELLKCHGASQIAETLFYGQDALIKWKDIAKSKNPDSQDFYYLYKYGDIHPYIPLAMMIAFPLAEILLLEYLSSSRKPRSEETPQR